MDRQRSLAGYSPWGCKELDMTEHLTLSLLSQAKAKIKILYRDEILRLFVTYKTNVIRVMLFLLELFDLYIFIKKKIKAFELHQSVAVFSNSWLCREKT